MALILFTLFLWAATATMATLAYRRHDGSLAAGAKDALRESVFIAPRLLVGILGAGFVAALLPEDLVRQSLGVDSGFAGLIVASAAGIIIPGGPVVTFAVGAAALEAGAGIGQVIGFVTAWLLMSLNRTLVWEMPIMGGYFMVFRYTTSALLPIAIGSLVDLLAG